MADGPFLRLYDLPAPIANMYDAEASHSGLNDISSIDSSNSFGEKNLQEIMEEIEKKLIVNAMDKVGGNKLVAANMLGISRPGLYKKLQKYNLQ